MNFEEILAPLDLQTYLAHNWDGESRYIPGTPDKFRSLYELKDFFRTLHRAPESSLHITATRPKCEGTHAGPRERIFASEVCDRLRKGATVCVSQIDVADEKLNDLAIRARCSLGYVGETHVNAYLSPPGSGFDAHFDARSIVNLQIAGRKKWNFEEAPSVRWPAGNALLVKGRIEYCDEYPASWELPTSKCDPIWREVILKPGDVLCMPAGALHSAKAESLSLALNLHFNALNVGHVLGEALSSQRVHQADWRHVPPILSGSGLHSGLGDASATHLRRVLRDAIGVLQNWHANVAELQELLVAWSSSHYNRKASMPRSAVLGLSHVRLAAEVSVLGGMGGGPLRMIVGESKIACASPHADMIRLCIHKRVASCTELVELAPGESGERVLGELVASGVFQLIATGYST